MTQGLKLSMEELIQTSHKEMYLRKLFIDSSNYLQDKDLMPRASSKISIDTNILRYLLSNSDKY